MTPEQVKQICDEAGLVILDRARWERVLANRQHMENVLRRMVSKSGKTIADDDEVGLWRIGLEPGDLDSVGEVE